MRGLLGRCDPLKMVRGTLEEVEATVGEDVVPVAALGAFFHLDVPACVLRAVTREGAGR